MKTITTNIYSYTELNEEAKAKALEALIRRECEHNPTEHVAQEMCDSLEAIAKACDLTLKSYSFGVSDRNSHTRVEVPHYHSMKYNRQAGPRARAWFARVLEKNGYAGPFDKPELTDPEDFKFTGLCYDMDIVNHIWNSLWLENDIVDAFSGISDLLSSMEEKEWDYLTSEKGILEALDKDEEKFLEDGELA